MFVDKHFINRGAYISKSKRCCNAKPSAYSFYMKTKMLLNFYICISVPLKVSRVKNGRILLVGWVGECCSDLGTRIAISYSNTKKIFVWIF